MFYIYAYLREDGSPYYVGKGSGSRAYSKNGRKTQPPNDKERIVFWHEMLEESEAFALEIFYIKLFGRKDNGTGILRNLTDGGEGASGVSESVRKLRSQNADRCWENPEYVKKLTSFKSRSGWKVTKPDGMVIYLKGLKWFCKRHGLHSSHLATHGCYKGWRAEKIIGK